MIGITMAHLWKAAYFFFQSSRGLKVSGQPGKSLTQSAWFVKLQLLGSQHPLKNTVLF